MRKIVEEDRRGAGVQAEAVVADAVGDGNVGGGEGEIVAECLVEDAGSEGYGGGLTLDEKPGVALAGINDNIEPLRATVEVDFFFEGDEPGGACLVADEVVDEMLAHPLLGGEGDETATDDVIDERRVALPLETVVEGRKGEVFHGLIFR